MKDIIAGPNKNDLAKALRFFIGRLDTFSLQQPDGHYIRKEQELSDSILLSHCRGDLTVGTYTTNDLGNSPLAVLDFDAREKKDPAIMAQQIEAIKSCGIIQWCKEWLAHYDIPCFVEFSGRKGYHLWIVFKKFCPADKARLLLEVMVSEWKKDNSEIDSFNIEYNPKQLDKRSFDEPGNLVKLPWGKHRVTGVWNPFVNGTFEPLPDWGLSEFNQARAITEMDLDAILVEYPSSSLSSTPTHTAHAVTRWQPTDQVIDIALKRIFEACAFMYHCKSNATSLERDRWFSMVSILTSFGEKAFPLIHELSKPYPQYSEKETTKYIDDAVKSEQKKGTQYICHTCTHIKRDLGYDCPSGCQAKGLEVNSPGGLANRLANQEIVMGRTQSVNISTSHKTGKQEIKVNCPRLAEEIKEKFLFKTFRDTEEVLYYDQGVYKHTGESLIKQEVSEMLGELTKRNYTLEVVHYVKTTTYANREDFDGDHFVLNLQNGLLDLRTMEIAPHTPSYLSTIRIPIKYDPFANCPNCQQFFSQVLELEDVPLMEEIMGYCLDPMYRFHKAFLFLGDGANGKSTMLSLLRSFLGAENCAGVTLQDLDFNRFASSYLWGKLANLCDELPQDTIKHAGKFKMLTGGGNVAAEQKFQSQFTFNNRAKLIFVCNKPPEIQNEDSFAFWRRWTLINFPNQFIGSQADPKLLEKLTTESEVSGLLNLALSALKRLWEAGEFSHSKSADDVAQQYLRAANPLFAFITDCCLLELDSWTSKDNLYSAYIDYCKRNNIPMLGKEGFSRKLKNTPDAKDVKSERHRVDGEIRHGWKGIKLSIMPQDIEPENTAGNLKPQLDF